MKTIKSVFPKMAGFFLIMVIITGVIYPLAITGISNVFFHKQATGSIIEADGIKYGSKLLAQEFTEDKYLWGRIMNVDVSNFTGEDGQPLMYSWASNKTPAGEELEAMVAERVERLRASNPERDGEPIPEDLVTCSGSGLDPEISPAAAKYQIQRIARARGMSEDQISQIIGKYTEGRTLGVFGEPRVNVLKVNLALDGILK